MKEKNGWECFTLRTACIHSNEYVEFLIQKIVFNHSCNQPKVVVAEIFGNSSSLFQLWQRCETNASTSIRPPQNSIPVAKSLVICKFYSPNSITQWTETCFLNCNHPNTIVCLVLLLIYIPSFSIQIASAIRKCLTKVNRKPNSYCETSSQNWQ